MSMLCFENTFYLIIILAKYYNCNCSNINGHDMVYIRIRLFVYSTVYFKNRTRNELSNYNPGGSTFSHFSSASVKTWKLWFMMKSGREWTQLNHTVLINLTFWGQDLMLYKHCWHPKICINRRILDQHFGWISPLILRKSLSFNKATNQ